MVGLASDEPEIAALFDGSAHGPQPIDENERGAEARLLPHWIEPELSSLVTTTEWPALLDRAPLDLRVNIARTSREAMLAVFEGSAETPLSPWGIRLPADSRIDQHSAFLEGLVEIQDEGSQLIALACEPATGMRIVDLCAGAGGKALALAAASGNGAEVLACDSNKVRLSKRGPRAERAGARIETRLSTAGGKRRSWPTGTARRTSSWSMRPARGAAPGGATRRGAGASSRTGCGGSPPCRRDCSTSRRRW
jgi:16S rRNA (cytosine967-C5)-methyltransferase